MEALPVIGRDRPRLAKSRNPTRLLGGVELPSAKVKRMWPAGAPTPPARRRRRCFGAIHSLDPLGSRHHLIRAGTRGDDLRWQNGREAKWLYVSGRQAGAMRCD